MYTHFVTKPMSYLFPDLEAHPDTVLLVLGDIAAFCLALLFINLAVLLFKYIQGPAYRSPAFTSLPPQETGPLLMPVEAYTPKPLNSDNIMPPGEWSKEDPQEDDAWDAVFYRSLHGDPGNYFIRDDPTSPAGGETSTSESDTPPPQRPVFMKLVRAGGVFRAFRDGAPPVSDSSSNASSRSRSAAHWPDHGLAQEVFMDPEMERVAARLVELRLLPEQVLEEVLVAYPEVRIAPVVSEMSGDGDSEEDCEEYVDPMDVDVAVTGLGYEDVAEGGAEELAGYVGTLYRLKMFVDERRVEEAIVAAAKAGGSAGSSGSDTTSVDDEPSADELVEMLMLRY